MKNALTVKKLEALRGKEKPYFIADGEGLYVLVRPTGTRVFITRMMVGGKRQEKTHGQYPALSLSAARELHGAVVASMTATPVLPSTPFADLFKIWIDSYATTPSPKTKRVPTPKTVLQHAARVRNNLPTVAALPINKITRRHVIEDLDKAKGREEARQTFNMLRVFFDWCVIRQHIQTSPLIGIRAQSLGLHAGSPEHRTLTLDEIKALWAACGNKGMPGLAIQVLILTGARRAMVAGMRWDEVGEWWSVPGARMKQGKPQSIYNTFGKLIEPCKLMQSEFVFPARGGAGHTHPDSLTAFSKTLGINDFSVHDIRRSVATAWREHLNAQPHIVELMLAHEQPKLQGTYQKATQLEEQKAVWKAWALMIAPELQR